ncbi:MAG: hypothetical protein IRZ03_17545 [Acidobacterium ailaaui]|nr:hypothetical protein [Pseudacidobacterium ailaaui]
MEVFAKSVQDAINHLRELATTTQTSVSALGNRVSVVQAAQSSAPSTQTPTQPPRNRDNFAFFI